MLDDFFSLSYLERIIYRANRKYEHVQPAANPIFHASRISDVYYLLPKQKMDILHAQTKIETVTFFHQESSYYLIVVVVTVQVHIRNFCSKFNCFHNR